MSIPRLSNNLKVAFSKLAKINPRADRDNFNSQVGAFLLSFEKFSNEFTQVRADLGNKRWIEEFIDQTNSIVTYINSSGDIVTESKNIKRAVELMQTNIQAIQTLISNDKTYIDSIINQAKITTLQVANEPKSVNELYSFEFDISNYDSTYNYVGIIKSNDVVGATLNIVGNKVKIYSGNSKVSQGTLKIMLFASKANFLTGSLLVIIKVDQVLVSDDAVVLNPNSSGAYIFEDGLKIDNAGSLNIQDLAYFKTNTFTQELAQGNWGEEKLKIDIKPQVISKEAGSNSNLIYTNTFTRSGEKLWIIPQGGNKNDLKELTLSTSNIVYPPEYPFSINNDFGSSNLEPIDPKYPTPISFRNNQSGQEAKFVYDSSLGKKVLALLYNDGRPQIRYVSSDFDSSTLKRNFFGRTYITKFKLNSLSNGNFVWLAEIQDGTWDDLYVHTDGKLQITQTRDILNNGSPVYLKTHKWYTIAFYLYYNSAQSSAYNGKVKVYFAENSNDFSYYGDYSLYGAKNRPINNISGAGMTVGGTYNNTGGFDGYISNFLIVDKELNISELNALKNKNYIPAPKIDISSLSLTALPDKIYKKLDAKTYQLRTSVKTPNSIIINSNFVDSNLKAVELEFVEATAPNKNINYVNDAFLKRSVVYFNASLSNKPYLKYEINPASNHGKTYIVRFKLKAGASSSTYSEYYIISLMKNSSDHHIALDFYNVQSNSAYGMRIRNSSQTTNIRKDGKNVVLNFDTWYTVALYLEADKQYVYMAQANDVFKDYGTYTLPTITNSVNAVLLGRKSNSGAISYNGYYSNIYVTDNKLSLDDLNNLKNKDYAIDYETTESNTMDFTDWTFTKAEDKFAIPFNVLRKDARYIRVVGNLKKGEKLTSLKIDLKRETK